MILLLTLLKLSFTGFNPDGPIGVNLNGNKYENKTLEDSHSPIDYRSGVLFWDFEGSNGGFNPIPPTEAWQWLPPVAGSAHSGIKTWGTYGTSGYYDPLCDWRLESPAILLDSAGGCTLSFYHWYSIDGPAGDGGNLKVSNDSGSTWSIIYPLGTSAYPCTASLENFGIPGEPCYAGDSFFWYQEKFLLDNYAGDEIIIRWHFGSDFYWEGWGWYIDDVRITGVKNSSGIIRDVGPISIDFPYSNVLPNITIHPKARCRNFGWQSESVLVFMRIDSLNITVYLQDTIVVIEPYTETTITFETWTTGGSGGIIYDIYTFTQLDGDQYPFNDTLHQHTVTSFSFWESLPAPFPLPSSGHSLASYDNGTYMVFGIHTPGNYLDTTLIYNISADIWIGGPKNPFGSASYGTVNVVNGRFYRIGGTCNFPNPLDRVDIYDPASNLWISGSPAPTGLIDHTSGIYKDSLIYILGNGNWSYPTSNLVYIYDTYTDNWITANPFPGPGRGACAGGIIDSFIIIACGFRDGGEFCNDYILGVINKSNPAFITWGQWQVIPGMDSGRCRIPYTIDILNKELWLVGGKLANNQETGEVWSYNPYTNIWTNWQLPKPHPVCNVAPVVITTTCYGNRGIFVPSGYHANQYIGEHELFHVWNQSVAEEEKGNLYSNFAYLRCLPNPVNKMCMIRYNTRCTQDIEIKIYDVAGRLVKKLVDRRLEPQGEKLIYWDVCDERGKPVPSGVYFVHLNSAEYTLIDKTTILRCGRYGSR